MKQPWFENKHTSIINVYNEGRKLASVTKDSQTRSFSWVQKRHDDKHKEQ